MKKLKTSSFILQRKLLVGLCQIPRVTHEWHVSGTVRLPRARAILASTRSALSALLPRRRHHSRRPLAPSGRPLPLFFRSDARRPTAGDATGDAVTLLGLVGEFRKDAQLVIVSHQKRTMEAGDSLLGVSMQPGGSSKVVTERASTATARAPGLTASPPKVCRMLTSQEPLSPDVHLASPNACSN